MKKIYFLIISILFASNINAQNYTDCSIVNQALPQAVKIRGLSLKQSVPCKLQNREQVEAYLKSELNSANKQARLAHEALIYKLLGFIPFDYDYINEVIQMYKDQIGGYYDPKKKFYVMADWIPQIMQMPVAVHELTHALQDQYFDLSSFINEEKFATDALISHSALAEGDGTAVMMDYSLVQNGMEPIAKSPDVEAIMMQTILGTKLTPGLAKVPQALQSLMIFPYTSGLNFAHKLLKLGGYKKIDEAFKNPPNSTEEILHPEIYLKKQKSYIEVKEEKTVDEFITDQKTSVYSDTIGEFLISTLLTTWLPPTEASKAASGWGGDKLNLYKNGNNSLLVWTINWDTTNDAKEFFTALAKAYAIRIKNTPLQSGSRVTFTDPKIGKVIATLSDTKVQINILNKAVN